jgi:muconolactone D-isomerase
VEFLVRFTWTVPPGMPDAQWSEIRTAERARGRELMTGGTMKRLWRLPGKRSVVGLFEVADATKLDQVLLGFPMHPYCEVEVEALGKHPLEIALESDASAA